MINLIVAATNDNGIGYKGVLPWVIKKDMQHFNETTRWLGRNKHDPQNICIMGRKTWESIPDKYRPLKGRTNVVVGSSFIEGVINFKDVELTIKWAVNNKVPNIFIIGGRDIFKSSIQFVDRIFLTRVEHYEKDIKCDVFLDPGMFENFERTAWHQIDDADENGYEISFSIFERDYE